MIAHALTEDRAELGESPLWDAAGGCLYWVDITGRRLHRSDAAGGAPKSWPMPSRPGMVQLRQKGGLVVALEDGLYGFEPSSGRLDFLVAIEPDRPENRANDGKCSPEGRLFVGTMHGWDAANATGALYCVSPDLGVRRVREGLRIPNGLAWSPDGRTLYHTDTRAGVVLAWDYDPETGAMTNEREFFSFDRARMGGVDGAAMAADGTYWAALYGGGRLVGVDPDGNVVGEVTLPVTQPTMPAFGGLELATLYVTSASQRLGADQLAAEPLAGALLGTPAPAGVVGHPVAAFRG